MRGCIDRLNNLTDYHRKIGDELVKAEEKYKESQELFHSFYDDVTQWVKEEIPDFDDIQFYYRTPSSFVFYVKMSNSTFQVVLSNEQLNKEHLGGEDFVEGINVFREVS